MGSKLLKLLKLVRVLGSVSGFLADISLENGFIFLVSFKNKLTSSSQSVILSLKTISRLNKVWTTETRIRNTGKANQKPWKTTSHD